MASLPQDIFDETIDGGKRLLELMERGRIAGHQRIQYGIEFLDGFGCASSSCRISST